MNAESQDVRVNQVGIDNSYSWDKHDMIRLGKGGVDDAEDAEVVVHEYGHAVHDAQVPGYGASLDAGAIGEAFGDYLAVTVGLDADRQYGWPVRAPRTCVMDWDATSYTSTVPHCLRRLDTGRVLEDRIGRVHYDGTSGATRCGTSGSGTSGSGSPLATGTARSSTASSTTRRTPPSARRPRRRTARRWPTKGRRPRMRCWPGSPHVTSPSESAVRGLRRPIAAVACHGPGCVGHGVERLDQSLQGRVA